MVVLSGRQQHQLSGRNEGIAFTGVVFAKGCEFLLVSLEGVGSGSGGWWEGLPVEHEGKVEMGKRAKKTPKKI